MDESLKATADCVVRLVIREAAAGKMIKIKTSIQRTGEPVVDNMWEVEMTKQIMII